MGVILERINDLHVFIMIWGLMAGFWTQFQCFEEIDEEVFVACYAPHIYVVFPSQCLS